MGANKLLADLGGKPVIVHVLDAIGTAGLPPPIIVCGHDAAALQGIADRSGARIVIATDWSKGLARSLAAGLAAVPADAVAAMICLGDMPFVSPGLLRKVADAAGPACIVAPFAGGRQGHPVLWGRCWFDRLLTLEGDAGGRGLIAANPAALHRIDTDEAGIHADVDTPAALSDARARLAGR